MSNMLTIRAIEFRELEPEPTDFPADGCSESGFIWSDNDDDGRIMSAADSERKFRREVDFKRPRKALAWLYGRGGGFDEALRAARSCGHTVEFCGHGVSPTTIAAVLDAG